MGNKYVQKYEHVVLADEQERRDRYNGCVSRQTLRAQLRREEQEKMRAEHPKVAHSVIRAGSRQTAKQEYRRLRGLDS